MTTITPIKVQATPSQTYEYLVYYIFGILDTLLIFRVVLKILGANPGSYFVDFVYSLTRFFILPFEGMFRRVTTEGIETVAVIEPSAIAAIVVYGLLAIGIVKLIRISSGEQQPVE